MSHVSKYKMMIKDIEVLKKVLTANGILYKENVKTSLYGSSRVDAALEFKLEGWRYACAVTKDGEIMYDHFGSSSNTFQNLGLTIKAYNKEVVMSKVLGFATNWWEEEIKDGIKLVVEC